jgi:hypothetical protein
MFRGPAVFVGTNGSLLASVCAVIASASSIIVLANYRGYRTAVALNVVAALLGAAEFALVASKDWHARPSEILAILSAAVCGATVPHLLRSEGRRKTD